MQARRAATSLRIRFGRDRGPSSFLIQLALGTERPATAAWPELLGELGPFLRCQVTILASLVGGLEDLQDALDFFWLKFIVSVPVHKTKEGLGWTAFPSIVRTSVGRTAARTGQSAAPSPSSACLIVTRRGVFDAGFGFDRLGSGVNRGRSRRIDTQAGGGG
jgi:hypothetical protein